MRKSDKEVVKIALQIGYPVLLWGPPGVGKTRFIESVCKSLGLMVETVIASRCDPTDFGGLPIVDSKDNVKLAPPSWAQRLYEAGKGVLFLDEISRGTFAVQNSLMRVVLDRWVGDLPLPPGVKVVAAANPVDTSAGTFDLGAALANRFLHIHVNYEVDAWLEGMSVGWEQYEEKVTALPVNWRDGIPRARDIISGFINCNRSALHDQPKDTSEQGKAWPSPRTWDWAATVFAAWQAVGGSLGEDSSDIMLRLMTAVVGEGRGLEFANWFNALDLPTPEELISGKKELPEKDDQLYVALLSVTSFVTENISPKIWKAGWKILSEVADKGKADIAVLSARRLSMLWKQDLHNQKGYKLPKEIMAFKTPLQNAGLLNA